MSLPATVAMLLGVSMVWGIVAVAFWNQRRTP
jgi:hypothetical protein